MEQLELQKRSGYLKIVFSDNDIVLYKKDREIVIPLDSIERIEYAKPSFLNFLGATLSGTYPGRFEIYLKEKIQKTKLYLVKIKQDEILRLPQIYRDRFLHLNR